MESRYDEYDPPYVYAPQVFVGAYDPNQANTDFNALFSNIPVVVSGDFNRDFNNDFKLHRMATFIELLEDIETAIVQNGTESITANVLRPILVSMLEYVEQQAGDLTELETTETTNLVGAINEVLGLFNNPTTVGSSPVQVLNVAADYQLSRTTNKAVHEIESQNGGPVTITIPSDTTVGATSLPPRVGDFFDLFQTDAQHVPVIVLGTNVVVYVEDGDTLTFTGIHSGCRLIKLAPNLWRFVRITKNGGAFREALTGSLLPGVDADKYTNGKPRSKRAGPYTLFRCKRGR